MQAITSTGWDSTWNIALPCYAPNGALRVNDAGMRNVTYLAGNQRRHSMTRACPKENGQVRDGDEPSELTR